MKVPAMLIATAFLAFGGGGKGVALGQAVELWNRRFPPAPGTGLHDWGVDVAASEESLFVAGATEVSPGVYKFFVSRYGHDGTLHQTVYRPGAASGLDAAGAAWARNFHEFYVTGSSFGGASLDDGLTVKYFDPIP